MSGRYFWSAEQLMRAPLLGAILGVSIHSSILVPVGRPVRLGQRIFAHPLDVIAIQHNNPHDRLDASHDWVVDQGARRFAGAMAGLVVEGTADRIIIGSEPCS